MLFKPKNIDLKDYLLYRKEAWKPKKYIYKNESGYSKLNVFDIKKWNNIQDNNIKNLKNKSFMSIGGGGTNKTTLSTKLNELYTLFLYYINKAYDMLRQKEINNVFIFDSHFKDNELTRKFIIVNF
jgi:hypothetical protein